MITQMKYNCLNGARTSKIHQDGAAPGLNHVTSATGGQTFMSRGTRGHKSLSKRRLNFNISLREKVLIYAAYRKLT